MNMTATTDNTPTVTANDIVIATTASSNGCGMDDLPSRARRQRGFSLIELMIAVAIVGILAAIAMPAYHQYVQKGRRVDAKNAVLDLAAREERYFATNNRYSVTASDLGYAAFPAALNTGGASYYDLNVTQTAPTNFTVTATPTGTQVNDACFAFSVDNLGVQSNSAAGGGANATAGCW